MFVITADQVNSRVHDDLASPERQRINDRYRNRLVLPADRTAGDEIQVLTDDAETALALVLELTRSGQWSVGIGCGSVRLPLPRETREASGDAFFAARDAVTRAKKQAVRFAIETVDTDNDNSNWPSAADADALIALLLDLRARRSAAGWELYDELGAGLTQREAAQRLGITPPSASSRARAAGLKTEAAAVTALTRLLENLDRICSARTPAE